jgi:hypothetical protein
MLHETGVTDYLIVQPNENVSGGTFQWTNDIEAARNNARSYYPQSEGIDVQGSKMYVVCKGIKSLFTFDLDEMTYVNTTTVSGLFDGSPDQMERIMEGQEGGLLYFTEEGGVDAGKLCFPSVTRSSFFAATAGIMLCSPSFSRSHTHFILSPMKEYMLEILRADSSPY